ncbi:Beta-galactosidase [Halotydeus destructor]|nr:Beta-galactosidase [Halotydeus destructor]
MMQSILLLALIALSAAAAQRSFVIDYENNQFLKDGQPFRYVSGSLQYYRVPRELWRDRLSKMRLAGVNAVETYVEWSSHEPEPGQFVDLEDIPNFIKIAQEEDLLVILRPGPFINNERDFGGYPYWIDSENLSMTLRSSDESYLKLVDRYLSKVMPLVRPLLYSNGGPVIKVQVENEYGHHGNDTVYIGWLRDSLKRYLVEDVLLFATDIPHIAAQKLGKVDDVYTTIDFGADANATSMFAMFREHVEPKGPLVNSEYYVGWIDSWSKPHETRSTELAVSTLKTMLDLGASVNIFMFHGGTSFGFKNGANGHLYSPIVTSYDWDAPLSEAGDPTDKYFAMRDLIGQYLPLPEGTLPTVAPKFGIESVQMYHTYSLSDIMSTQSRKVTSEHPMTFEQLKVDGGYVVYKTTIDFHASNPSKLSIPGLKDRAQIIIDGQKVGTLTRVDGNVNLPVWTQMGSELIIVVENQGRDSFGPKVVEDHIKGIVGHVTLGLVTLTNWTHYCNLKLDGPSDYLHIHSEASSLAPAVYGGSFMVPQGAKGRDTFLRLDGWGKGVAYINGINIGRYWPDEGPQVTLYVPHVWLRPDSANYVYLFETERAPCGSRSDCVLSFTESHVLNVTTPANVAQRVEYEDLAPPLIDALAAAYKEVKRFVGDEHISGVLQAIVEGRSMNYTTN